MVCSYLFNPTYKRIAMLDVLVILLVTVLGFTVKKWINRDFSDYNAKILNWLWAYHLLFGVFYYLYIAYGPGGDALGYWRNARSYSFVELLALFELNGPGTYGMLLINYFPSNALGLGLLASSLIYTLLGYVGIAFFYALCVNNIKFNSKIGKYSLFPLLFFLPNFHFWSAGLGKDTICFMSIGLFVYSMQQPSKNLIKIAIAMGLTYLVRPHISLFLVAAFGIAFMLDGNLKVYQKALLSVLFLGAFIVLFDVFTSFIEVENLNAQTISKYSDGKAAALNVDSGSGVDISSYPYPLKVLTYLYRPLFFDINGILAVVASFENLILLLLSIKFIRLNPFKFFMKGSYLFKGCFIFFLIGTLTFSLILGNLGIMLREKNMFTPAFFFFCLWAYSYATEQQRQTKAMELA